MVTLIKASENKEHLQRHANSESLTVGSKVLSGVEQSEVAKMLQTFDEAYAKLIAEKGDPGRQYFCLRCEHPVGTNALASKSDLNKGVKPVTITRDIGSPYEKDVQVVLIDPKDMPRTDLVYGIYGPYGPTGQAGIYTMVFGDPGMPFPKKLDEKASEADKAQNAACEKYWKNHVFLCTPDEMRAAISEMAAAGRDVSKQTAALLSFQAKGGVCPLKDVKALVPSKEAVLLSFKQDTTEKKTQNNHRQSALLMSKIQQHKGR